MENEGLIRRQREKDVLLKIENKYDVSCNSLKLKLNSLNSGTDEQSSFYKENWVDMEFLR